MTVAAFMEIALYAPQAGYYARAAQRSGRAGDFFTSVDVGPVFGELLEIQLEEMADLLSGVGPLASDASGVASDLSPHARGEKPRASFDLVEAGAGNGRLAADILGAARLRNPLFYNLIRLHLVEASEGARVAQRAVLADITDRFVSSTDGLPASFEGALIANELLDAMPVHQVVMSDDGLREVYVDAVGDELVTRDGPPSTPALAEYLARAGVTLAPGCQGEINLLAIDWIRQAARHLARGFIILIDYGHCADELYSAQRAHGTLATFARHSMAGPEPRTATPCWLQRPGEQDITAHVDFTSVRAAAEAAGLTTLGFLDQTYFLIGLLSGDGASGSGGAVADPATKARALRTLLLPGGLGSTHKVLLLGKNVGTPSLRGCSFGGRVT
jgi:SAM-dependent MidA family methyltransferase